MAKVQIHVPGGWVKNKKYVIEFDPDKMTGIELKRDMADVGGQKELSGANSITFKFASFEDAPRWVEVDEHGEEIRSPELKGEWKRGD